MDREFIDYNLMHVEAVVLKSRPTREERDLACRSLNAIRSALNLFHADGCPSPMTADELIAWRVAQTQGGQA